jgi:hypothetical protein
MGAQLSTRAVVLLGVNFVCAQAGDEIKSIARTSFFIGLSRGTCAVGPLLNRIRQKKSNHVLAPRQPEFSSIAGRFEVQVMALSCNTELTFAAEGRAGKDLRQDEATTAQPQWRAGVAGAAAET